MSEHPLRRVVAYHTVAIILLAVASLGNSLALVAMAR